MDEIRCPMCGKLNPAENDVCQFCEARLKPLTGPIQDQNSANDDDWLGSLRSDSELSGGDETDWYEEESGESEDGQRDPLAWLSSMDGSEETSHDIDQPPASSVSQPENHVEDQVDLSSWLASLDETEEEPTAEKTSPEDLPEWLSEIGQDDESESVEIDPTIPEPISTDDSEEDVPEWLSAFGESKSSEEQQSDGIDQISDEESTPQPITEFHDEDQLPSVDKEGLPTETEAEGLPDWLQDSTEEVPSTVPGGDEELLDWLSEATNEEVEESLGEPQQIQDTEFSEWLSESEIEDLESSGEPAVDSTQEDLESVAEEALMLNTQSPKTEDFQLDDEPDWLDEFEPEEIEPMASGLVDADLPDPSVESAEWLSGLASDVKGESEDSSKSAEDHETVPFSADSGFDEELEALYLSEDPDWLADVTEEVDAGEGEFQDDGIAPAELPAWLAAMRPVDAVVASQMASEDSQVEIETAGPLAGMENVLPAETNIFQIRKPEAFSVKLDVNESQQKHIAMMRQMLKDEELPEPIDKPAQITSQRVLRWIIASVFLVITFFALWSGTGFSEIPGAGVEIQAVRSVIDTLPGQSPVLVAVDYEPGMSGEMDVVALSVLEHLMRKNALLTFVSTTPAGPILAENLLTVLGQSYDLTRTSEYINLGYIPGGAAGLQSLSNFPVRFSLPYTYSGYDPWTERVTPLSGIEAVADFPLILVITDRQETARNWIEQVGPDLGESKMVMAVSAQIGPYIRPYYKSSSQTVDGYLSGVPGSSAYESIVGLPDRSGRYWNVFSVLVVFSAGIIVVGGLVNVVMSNIKPRSSSEDKQNNEP